MTKIAKHAFLYFIILIFLLGIFNYVLSLNQLEYLENERQCLLNLIAKQRELEKLLYRENELLKEKLLVAEKRSSQPTVTKIKEKPLKTGKETQGNRGFLFKKK